MSIRYLVPVAAIAAISCTGGAAAQTSWRVGDKVSVWVSADYYDGTVVEVGSGDHAGQYLIHFDKFSSNQYALAKNVVARRGTPQRSNARTGTNGCRIMVVNGLPVCDPASVRR